MMARHLLLAVAALDVTLALVAAVLALPFGGVA
jgi:hypothetical protein